MTSHDMPILDVPPPILSRRRALGAAAAGLTTVALPSALASASSIPETAPSAYEYSGQEVISYWTPFDTDTADYGSNGGVAATNDSGSLNGRLTRGGATQGVSSLNLADPEISTAGGATGLTGYSEFAMRNSSNVLDLASSPHLQFNLAMTGGTTTLATFVLYSVRQMSASPAVNLAFYVSTDGFTSATLRRTATLVQGYRHLVVNLGLLQTFSIGSIVSVRIYPYSTPTANGVRLGRFNLEPSTPAPLVSPQDIVNESVVGSRTSAAADHIAAFIGTHV